MKKWLCLLLVAIMCFCFAGCADTEMDSDELTAKRIISQADDGVDNIEYVEFLECANNGYKDYYYYDVVTIDGTGYIVEIRDTGTRKEYCSKHEYNSNSQKSDDLQDLIEYRCSDFGALGDSIDYADDMLNSYY